MAKFYAMLVGMVFVIVGFVLGEETAMVMFKAISAACLFCGFIITTMVVEIVWRKHFDEHQ